MIKKICCFIMIIASMCFSGCDSGDPPYKIKLNVPYHCQTEYNFCAPACIQMWAEYDTGFLYPQSEIAGYIGVGAGGIDPYSVRDGVNYYTFSQGYVAYRYLYEPGAPGDLISACIEGIKEHVPAIMPFYGASHAILVIGFEWHEDVDRPIAEVMYYHDPDEYWGSNISITGSELEFNFTPIVGIYYVIVGDSWFDMYGTIGHDNFVIRRGTYYGGPSFYDPKGLLPDPNPNQN
ncbi:MAG: hypothetical protein JSV88_29760 [Candidatus Aminicenantes bacterium]|nr:MAG: hypothetical protein JSV88_29760 [Candidatus Aminicenantes bacterium]